MGEEIPGILSDAILKSKMFKGYRRPGGRSLSVKMLEALHINRADDIVEFASGPGYSAKIALEYYPHSYTGIDSDANTVKQLRGEIKGSRNKILTYNGYSTGLFEQTKDIVFGEAMLATQCDQSRRLIIQEAFRILKKEGLYGIHELGLISEDIDPAVRTSIDFEMRRIFSTDTRLLTVAEWRDLLEVNGFKIRQILTSSIYFGKILNILKAEGILRTLKIGLGILLQVNERRRFFAMRKLLSKYQQQMKAVAIIAEKA
jgi:SAM-dependent methyltransferase